jgi:hypothetical protein
MRRKRFFGIAQTAQINDALNSRPLCRRAKVAGTDQVALGKAGTCPETVHKVIGDAYPTHRIFQGLRLEDIPDR